MESLAPTDWQSLIHHLDDKILLLDHDFTILFANEAVLSSLSEPPEGRRCFEVFNLVDAPCAGCPVTLVLAASSRAQPPPERQCRRVRCFPLRREAGKPTLLGVEMARSSPAVHASASGAQAWLSEILGEWGAPVVATAPDDTVLVFNREAEVLLGYDATEVVGQMRAGSFLAEGNGAEVYKKLHSDAFGGKGKFFSEEVTLRHASGAIIPVTLRGVVLAADEDQLATVWFVQPHDADEHAAATNEKIRTRRFDAARTTALQNLASGLAQQMRNPLTGTVLFSNVLMQELVRRELQRADAFLWNLIQSSVDAIIATDTKGNIFIFNDEACQVLGYDAKEVVGQYHISQIYPIEEAREIMRRLRSDAYGGKGKLLAHDMELIGKDGQGIPVRLNASLVFVNNQEFGSVGFFQDQRERIKMEQELQRAQVQLLQSEKMASLGKLAAGIAHQINNPLSGIVLFSNLLLEDTEMAEKPDWVTDLKRIADEAERCRSIVKELLEFARQTQGKVKAVSLNRALGQTIFLLEKQALFHNIEIVQEFSEETPEIYADPQQLNHVFMNLILNAAEAMDGRGTLSIGTRLCEPPDAVAFWVEDTGYGIPDEIKSRVFEPFFTTKEVGKGTGLGLSMVYGIVERHGGTIRIDSEVDRGTKFTVTLPIGEIPME